MASGPVMQPVRSTPLQTRAAKLIVLQPTKVSIVKTLYLDIFSGISGDMFDGALLDLGVELHQLERGLARLGLGGYHLHIARGHKASIEGVKFDVHLEEDHAHEHHHPDHEHDQHHHSADHTHAPTGSHGGPLAKTSFGQVELSVFETNVP